MVSEDALLKAMDKPRTLYALRRIVDPAGSEESLQILLMKLRDEGKVRFDIKKGLWRLA